MITQQKIEMPKAYKKNDKTSVFPGFGDNSRCKWFINFRNTNRNLRTHIQIPLPLIGMQSLISYKTNQMLYCN